LHGFGLRARNFTVFAETTDDVFGINVFKVREVMPVPKISRPPEAGEAIEGVVSMWGTLVPVVHLPRYGNRD